MAGFDSPHGRKVSPHEGGKAPNGAKYICIYARARVRWNCGGCCIMEKNEVWFWVWAEYTDKLGRICRYSRSFDTLEEGERAYNMQVNKGRFTRLYRRGRVPSGYGFAEVLKRNF